MKYKSEGRSKIILVLFYCTLFGLIYHPGWLYLVLALFTNGEWRYKYFILGHEETFLNNYSDSNNKYSEDYIIRILVFVVDTIFSWFCQTSGCLAFQWVHIVATSVAARWRVGDLLILKWKLWQHCAIIKCSSTRTSSSTLFEICIETTLNTMTSQQKCCWYFREV